MSPNIERYQRVVVAAAVALVLCCCDRDASSSQAPSLTPTRIVALTIGAVDTLDMLGELGRVVAVEADCFVPGTEHMTKIKNDDHAGPSQALNVEAVLALRPDLVIAKEDLKPALEGRGLNVLWMPSASDLAAIERNVQTIGERIGAAEKARQLVFTMHARTDAIRAHVADLPRVRVYYEAGRPGRTAGQRTVMNDMIRLAGGVNIGESVDLANPSLSAEAIVAADPEVIVLSPWSETPEQIRARPGWDRISAVRNGRVHSMSERDRRVQSPSPRCVEACERELVPWLHPALASKVEGGG